MRYPALSLLFLACFTSLLTQAQDKKFDLSLNVFPNYTWNTITNDGTTPPEVESAIADRERGKLAWGAAVMVERKLSKHSTYGFGLGYLSKGEQTEKSEIYTLDPNTLERVPLPNGLTHTKFVYARHYLDIPFFYRYSLGSKLYVQGGVNVLLNLTSTIRQVEYFDDDSIERTTETNENSPAAFLGSAATLGIGYNYLRTDRFTFFVQPQFQYDLLGAANSTPLNRLFRTVGVTAGVRL